ncbi:X-linked retinitis pigmentosa GTPase regulator-like isoform X2 [Gigantopelta aegis]|uniref:X-linked retinitis pigmentosa GTPase regulator-like isoform X2 n=1 Tax=Gigantopelta aegis TaxID=1735272 RepID=UPI001B8888A0|nr:X-linked retinitis pigmentosa GTPase regulator-like isoform X2 [Gigantopelta aegis]
MSSVDDSDIPETGAVFTFGKSSFAENLPNKFWVKNDRVLQISCGDEHTALVAESGRVFMFGPNNWGQLGLDQIKTANKPYCIKSLKREKVLLIACGRSHTFVATESGLLYSFGSNSEGQLGIPDIQESNVPKCIDSIDATPFKMLGAGAEHSVALTEDGRVFVWGSNNEGQLGLEDDEGYPTPKELDFDENIICIACGYYHTAIVTESGHLYTFGENDCGKLGLGHKTSVSTPEHVSSISDKVKAVSCGGSHTAALTENGTVYTFGEGNNGQLGLGTMTMETLTPQLVKMGPTVSHIFCGENFTAFITERGQLYTCGDGRHGKLAQGIESFTNLYKPTCCDSLLKFYVNRVACGGCHMIVTAYPRRENGHIGDGEEFAEEENSQLEHTLKSDNSLELSVSARVRRRNTFNKNTTTLNRTLPSLGHNRPLPLENTTLPLHNSQKGLNEVENHLSKTMVPSIDLQKSSATKAKHKDHDDSNEDELESDEDEHKTKPKVLPRVKPVPRVRHTPVPKPAPRREKKKERRTESEESLKHDEEEADGDKKDMKKDKRKSPKKTKMNIFGKKKVLDDKTDEEEADDEDDLSEDEERQKEELKKKEMEKEKRKKKKGSKEMETKDDEETENDKKKGQIQS